MLALKYTLFAVISTVINLLFQYSCFQIYSGFASLYIAMFVGTIAGLITKYILDKKWIFYDVHEEVKSFESFSMITTQFSEKCCP